MRRIGIVALVVFLAAVAACPESSVGQLDHVVIGPRNISTQFQPAVLGSGRLEQMPVGDTLFVNGDVQIATAGDYLQLIQNTGTAVAPKITAYAGNPNTHVSGTAGDFLVDASTPALWQSTGGTAWTEVSAVTLSGTSPQVAVFSSATALTSYLALTAGSAGLTIESTNGSATSIAALLSTISATSTNGNNLCIGGGCQSVAYDGTQRIFRIRRTWRWVSMR